MSWLGSSVRAAFGYVDSLNNPENGFQHAGPLGYKNDTKEVVSDERALGVSAVFACTRLLVQSGSSLPLHVYRSVAHGREEMRAGNLVEILNRPNNIMTALQFRAAMWAQRVLWGNAFAEIKRSSTGRVVALWPLRPAQISIERRMGKLIYNYSTEQGLRQIAQEDMLHIRGFSPEGTLGLSPLAYARYTLGVSVSADKRAAVSFSGTPNGFLRMAEWPNDEQKEDIRTNYSELGTSEVGDGSFWLLPGGMEFDHYGLPPDDLQMLQSRQFQIGEVARFFGVPVVLLDGGAQTSAWPASYEQQMLSFLQFTMRPYLEEFEDAINSSLAPKGIFVEHNAKSLLRTDSKSRAEYYRTMVANGLMTVNEVRKEENLPPIEGGDEARAQVNMAPITELNGENINANQGSSEES